MQVIIYTKGKYNPDFIKKISDALVLSWPLEDMDMVVIFDNSTRLICAAPTMVRIFTPHNNPSCVSMSCPSFRMKGSHFDANKLFQQFESKQNRQLIFIEKNTENRVVSNKIINQLLKCCSSPVDINRALPKALQFLKYSFLVFAQTEVSNKLMSKVIPLNQNKQKLPQFIYSLTGTSVLEPIS